MGLKTILYKEFIRTGYLSINDFNSICDRNFKKRSNGERRMRELHVERDLNAHGAIVGYRLTPQTPPDAQNRPINDLKTEQALFDLPPVEHKMQMPN